MLAFPNNRTATILELKILFIATTQHCFCDKTLHFHTLLLSSLQVALSCPACEWEEIQVSVSRALMQVPKHLKQPQGFIEAAPTSDFGDSSRPTRKGHQICHCPQAASPGQSKRRHQVLESSVWVIIGTWSHYDLDEKLCEAVKCSISKAQASTGHYQQLPAVRLALLTCGELHWRSSGSPCPQKL